MKASRIPAIEDPTSKNHSRTARIARSEPVKTRSAGVDEISEEKLFSDLVDREMKRVSSSENQTFSRTSTGAVLCDMLRATSFISGEPVEPGEEQVDNGH